MKFSPPAYWLGILMLATTASVLQADDLSSILPEQAEVEELATGFKFTEGPAWHPEGFLLFSDIPNARVIKREGDGKLTDFYTPSGRVNGIMCDQQGNVYCCQMGEGHVLKLNAEGELQGMLVDTFEGKRMNGPNDLAIDEHGGMYFTDPYYGPAQDELPQPMMAVYYITAEGKVSRIIEDRERPNGVTVSPDGKTLYVAEPNHSEVYSYDILGPGKISAGKLIFKGEEQDGSGPDGMVHDQNGNLYCTYNGIVVLNPAGKLIGRIETPQKPSNCTFGGEDSQTLFITARTGLYQMKLNSTGVDLPKAGPKQARQPQTAKTQTALKVMTVADESEKAAEETVDVNAGDLTLHVPRSWDSQPPNNNLRLAQFNVPGKDDDAEAAEMVVFPPFGGSVNDNMARWVRQFDTRDLKLEMVSGKSDSGEYYLLDATGTYKKPDGPPFLRKTIDVPDHRMMAVMLNVEGKGNYFLKLVGPKATVEAAADAFRKSFGADPESEKEYKLK